MNIKQSKGIASLLTIGIACLSAFVCYVYKCYVLLVQSQTYDALFGVQSSLSPDLGPAYQKHLESLTKGPQALSGRSIGFDAGSVVPWAMERSGTAVAR